MSFLKQIFLNDSKKSIEQKSIERMQAIAKQLRKRKGGAVSLCYEFVDLCKQSASYAELGILIESEIEIKKLDVLVAAIVSLNIYKDIEDEQKELVYEMAKFSYIKASLILDDDEMKEVLLAPADQFHNYKEERLKKAEEAWNHLQNSEEFLRLFRY